MPDNRNRKFIVIAEIERVGYLVGTYKEFLEARKKADQLLKIRDSFAWGEENQLKHRIETFNYRTYRIAGNQVFFDKGIYGSTDSRFSVSVIVIDKTIQLETFILERQNHSIPFNDDLSSNELYQNYFEDFPDVLHNAN